MTLEIDEENVPADPIFRTFMDRRGVGHRRGLPFDDAIRPEVHSEFTAMIGGNDVATCAKTWFFGWNPGSGVIFLDFLPTPHNTLQQQAKDLAEADRAALVDKYSIRAVALLKEDRSLGYFKDPTKVAHMKKDTNLDPLRERDDFKQLIKSFEADEQE